MDNRIGCSRYSLSVKREIQNIVNETGDCIVGILMADALSLDVNFISSPEEIEAFKLSLKSTPKIWYGPFPARDNDGVSAVTITLPDRDGKVRAHPH